MRTLLLVRAGEDDLAQALQAGSDAVVVELPEDADPTVLAALRSTLDLTARNEARPLVFVRLPAIDAPDIDTVLAALLPAEPEGFVLGRCAGGADVQQLGAKLAVYEAELDLADGQTGIIAEIGGVARSLLALDSFVGCSPRLLALAWNPQALAAALGLDDGEASPSMTARSLVVLAAGAAEVAAIDWDACPDHAGFQPASTRARRDGFHAKLASTPDQLAIIDAVFAA